MTTTRTLSAYGTASDALDAILDNSTSTLAHITSLVEIQEMLAGRLEQAVDAARCEGHGWEAIGNALGVTRQSAHQRYR